MTQPPAAPMRLSQTSLSILATCPRKFQHLYLDQLAVPLDYEAQAKINQGSQFHLLMQQWQLGLPIAAFLEADSQLQQWFASFKAAAEDILSLPDPPETIVTQSEHIRIGAFQGYLFTAVYDLLLLGASHAKILDWKTYPRPKQPQWLQRHWQSRLYPWLLANSSQYAPEQIQLIYWFFQTDGASETPTLPQCVTFPYNQAQHDRTSADLTQLLRSLTQWRQDYDQGQAFPQIADDSPCQSCSFAPRCDRHRSQPAEDLDPLLDLEAITEIPL